MMEHEDIIELIADPDFCTEFTLLVPDSHRADDGEWHEALRSNTRTGVVQPAGLKDTRFLPQGEQNRAAINVWSTDFLTAVDERCPQMGDVIQWNCSTYRIVSVRDWSQYGYWRAMAVQFVERTDNEQTNTI